MLSAICVKFMLCVVFSRNYHVFYYLLLGASEEDRKEFKLLPPEDYFYLKQVQYHPAVAHHILLFTLVSI